MEAHARMRVLSRATAPRENASTMQALRQQHCAQVVAGECSTSRRTVWQLARRARTRCAVAKTETEPVVAEASSALQPTQQQLTGRVARLAAQKDGSVRVQELSRPLAEYMALPASQYSVLDARMIERVSDSMFRCYVGQLKMFGWSAEPVLTVSVTVERGGCTIRLLSCQIKGSPQVEELNNQFTAQMTNVVRFRDCEEEGCGTDKDITSTTSLEVCLQVPGWCGFLPVRSIEEVGSSVLQQVLNLMVPRFLKQLDGDYQKWAKGEGRKLAN